MNRHKSWSLLLKFHHSVDLLFFTHIIELLQLLLEGKRLLIGANGGGRDVRLLLHLGVRLPRIVHARSLGRQLRRLLFLSGLFRRVKVDLSHPLVDRNVYLVLVDQHRLEVCLLLHLILLHEGLRVCLVC
mmetsp:Transcript_23664/g.23375  ORF Transcript_23664/g.23375 Transcript_23664/m.23375 type:complete len:130 (-) Transcript_23664:839-1228(-)